MATWVVGLTLAPAGPDGLDSVHSPPPLVARARKLGRSFGGRTVLSGLDLDVAAGEFVALLGRSGEGKSTLLRALAGLDRDTAGEVAVKGTVAVAFQDPRLLPWKRVLANVSVGPPGRGPYGRRPRRPRRGRPRRTGKCVAPDSVRWGSTTSLAGQGARPGAGPVAPGRALLRPRCSDPDGDARPGARLMGAPSACRPHGHPRRGRGAGAGQPRPGASWGAGRRTRPSCLASAPAIANDHHLLRLRDHLLAELGVDQKGNQ